MKGNSLSLFIIHSNRIDHIRATEHVLHLRKLAIPDFFFIYFRLFNPVGSKQMLN